MEGRREKREEEVARKRRMDDNKRQAAVEADIAAAKVAQGDSTMQRFDDGCAGLRYEEEGSGSYGSSASS